MLIGKVSLLYHKDFGKYVLAFENAMSCFVLFIYWPKPDSQVRNNLNDV